jgi:hypothetical protein
MKKAGISGISSSADSQCDLNVPTPKKIRSKLSPWRLFWSKLSKIEKKKSHTLYSAKCCKAVTDVIWIEKAILSLFIRNQGLLKLSH